MHTFYITGGTCAERTEYMSKVFHDLNIASYDIHYLLPQEQHESIGISDIRGWQKKLFLTPLTSPYTIGIIPNAELLTNEAQHALLKTLEEPPSHTQIYIESEVSSILLPTILSRCQMIQLTTHPMTSRNVSILQLCDATVSTGKKMAILDNEISNKEEAKIWVTQAMYTLHANRYTLPATRYRFFMQRLLTASQHLSFHVSFRLAIDHIFLIQ